LGRLTIEPSLAWLLAPLTVETFLDTIWTATHYHVKRHCAGYFDSLLHGPSAVEELLELFRREPSAVRLMRGNDKKSGSDSYRLVDGSLDLVGIRNDFADGFTIVADGVERYVRAIASLAHSIEVELNFPIQVNAYITPPGSRGLVPHYDDHDVLVLQIQGSKIWHLYNGVDIPAHEMQRRDKAVPTDGLPLPTDLRLEVGDVLYLPRGLVHAADTNAEPSIHLTVGIHAPTALTLAIGTLHSLSFHDDRLNARLPPRHLDDADLHATLGVLMRDAVRTVEDPNAIAEGLDALADVLIRRGRCPPVGPISNAGGIDGQTLVTKYKPLYSRVKAVAGGVALQFAKLSINAAVDHEPALLFISRSTEPFRVRDLPGLRAEQQIELARKLIVSGFLVRLSDD
jgi:ribosomal protein L16 Arg81 hydroxylase